MKARLQTVGVEEHAVEVEEGNHPFPGEVGQTWFFYDVGGSRHQRGEFCRVTENQDANMIVQLHGHLSLMTVRISHRV